MSNFQQHPPQATLILSNKDGLLDILGKVDIAITNIYRRRKESLKYFKEELFIAKNKHESFQRWNLDEHNNLTITPPPRAPQSPGTIMPMPSFTTDHQSKTFNNLIKYQFKSAISNLKNTNRTLKMALRYQGQVEISADILNNTDYFGNNAECVAKLDKYCKKTVDQFIQSNIPNEVSK